MSQETQSLGSLQQQQKIKWNCPLHFTQQQPYFNCLYDTSWVLYEQCYQQRMQKRQMRRGGFMSLSAANVAQVKIFCFCRVEGRQGRSDLTPGHLFFFQINVFQDDWCNFFHHLGHFTGGAQQFLMRGKRPKSCKKRKNI